MEDPEIQGLIGCAPRLAFEDIVSHPRLPKARKVYLDRFLEVYGDELWSSYDRGIAGGVYLHDMVYVPAVGARAAAAA